jgi:TRAP transporter 4TM/12TM fusion protein
VNTNQKINDDLAELPSAEYHDPSTASFPTNIEGRLLFYIAIAFSVFQVVTAAHLLDLPSQVLRAAHVGFLGLLALPLVCALKKQNIFFKIISWIGGILCFAVALYQTFQYEALLLRTSDLLLVDVVFGVTAVILVFIAAWLVMGYALSLIAGIFLLYCFFGNYLTGMLQHRGYDFKQIVEHMSYGTEGIYGIPTYVSCTFVFLFILFGSFLERAGMIKLFNDVALGLFGHTRGGPAQVCVASSALMGTISGSGIANVVTSGQFTIPLMKKYGYSPAFAGGVEATSSMGGQIMPPVMGAVAFIMAETLGVKYVEIVKAAIIPAILYYISCWWMVYLEAGKKKLLGIPKDQLPSASNAIKRGWYLTIPLIILVYLLFSGYTPLYAGTIGLAFVIFLILGAPIAGKLSNYKRVLFWIILGLVSASFFEIGIKVIVASISTLVLINFIFRGGRETLLSCRDALAEGAKASLPVGVACAVIGIVIGTLTLTGAANTFGQFVIKVGENSLLLSLILTMIVCLILGMGIPTIPNYIITSAIAGPALLKLGVPLIISHMFVFYFGIMADLTPPVALACFAAAPFAKESGFKISLEAVKLAVAGFVVPFMAVYSPELMLQGLANKDIFTIIISVGYISIKALIAMLFLGIAAVGYMNKPVNIFERIICICVSVLLITAIPITDELGFGLMIIFIIYRWFKFRKINPNTQ